MKASELLEYQFQYNSGLICQTEYLRIIIKIIEDEFFYNSESNHPELRLETVYPCIREFHNGEITGKECLSQITKTYIGYAK